jgi:formate dehydrogenase accessory protein FdhE
MNTQVGDKLYLDLCQEIRAAKSAFLTKHQDDAVIQEAEIQKRKKENKPLLDIQKLKIKQELLDSLYRVFSPILTKYGVFSQEETKEFLGGKDDLNLSQLTGLILGGDFQSLKSLSTQYQLKTDSLLFIGLNLSQAVLELYAQKLKLMVDQENWLKGICPVCGNFPAMEKLRREDGKKMLWCAFCGTQWHHKRIMCPFCGNEDHNALRYFFTEGDSSSKENPFRVDVCDQCKRYIKTVDERKLPEKEIPDFPLDHIKTLYLDVLAQKDGYQSPTFWITTPGEKESI